MENNYNSAKDKKIKNLLNTCTRLLSNGLYYKAYTGALSILDIDNNNAKAKKIACLCLIQMYDIQTAISFFDNKDTNLKSIFDMKKNEIVNNCNKYPDYHFIIKLLNTLSIHNAFFPKVEIFSHSKNNRGVIAKRFITQNEIIMTIPKECILTVDIAIQSDIGKQISVFMNRKLNSPKHSLLSSFILYEKNKENSQWKFYYDIFPKDFHTYPFFYNESENILLNGSKFLLKVKEKRKDIEEDYNVLCSLIDNYKDNISFSDFFTMRIIVSSRIFGIKINGIKVDALVPLADMLNHSSHNQTSWYYDDQIESFVVQAIEDIKEGDEIFDSYGKKPNSSYLLNYGFTIDNNEENNEYPLTLMLNRDSCELFSLKENFINSELGYERTFNITHQLYDANVIDLFSYLRFVCFDNEDNIQLLFDEIRKGQDYTYINKKAIPLFYHIEPFSIENELEVLNRLKEICQCELTNYHTSYEEDIEILNGEFTYNQRNCIIIRMSEKEILLFYIAFCDYCKELLSLNSKDKIISKVSYDYKDSNCPYEYYISNILHLY